MGTMTKIFAIKRCLVKVKYINLTCLKRGNSYA